MLNKKEKMIVKYAFDNVDTSDGLSENAYFMVALEAISKKDLDKLAKDVDKYLEELRKGE